MARRQLITGKVTAQRKFAQGAFVPPHAIAVNNNASERREAPSTNSTGRDTCTQRYSNMSMDYVLDYISFRNNHAHHQQPIVLVERLPERKPTPYINQPTQHINRPTPHMNCIILGTKPNTTETNHILPRARPTVRHRKVPIQKAVHVMHLRSSDRSTNSNITTTNSKRKNNIPSRIRRKISKPKPKQKVRPKPTYRFSVDDNRPLKYLASRSNHRKQKPESSPGPSTSVENATNIPTRTLKRKSLKRPIRDTEEETPSPGETSNSPILEPKIPRPVVATGETSNSSPILQVKLPRPVVATVQEPARVEQPSKAGAFSASRSPSYYSEQGIHRWIDGHLPKDPELTARSSPTIIDTITINDDDSSKGEACPSVAWRTVNDVVHLSKAEYMSKCHVCLNCKRLEKYENICFILKTKYNINDSIDSSETLNWQPMLSRDLDINRSSLQDSVEIIYMEMLPRHPHLMIKCEINTNNNRNVLCTHLIPRSKAEISTQFSFTEHEFILNNWIESVILNTEESTSAITGVIPNATIKTEINPVAGSSGCQVNGQSMSEDKENSSGKILNAPTFHPTVEEFTEPMAYFEKISDQAAKYGICKIVLPAFFAPPCNIDDNIKFQVFNQYISRLYNRWGPATRELCAIQSSLKDNQVSANRPVIDGVEVNLPKLYHLVQHHGGLETVMNKNKWAKVAEDMNLNKGPSTAKKLDQIYVTYLLPYNALTPQEHQDLFLRVEKSWNKRNERMLQRANNPLHIQKYLLGESDESSDESDDDATKDVEDCVHLGQNMNLGKFKRVAKNAQFQFFKNKAVPLSQIEQEYWRMVICGTEHVCVNSASIDTGEQGIGFPTNGNDNYSDHEWNLKKMSQNPANILRSLGPVLGVTVPTLHLGMIFSSSCWHRDPHSVPWIEFQHTGPTKLWYSVPEVEGTKFRNSSKTLFPTSCQNKDLWLSSDISMIPPNLLAQQNMKVYRVEQNPGEFVLVMPRAYSCSICTGFTISESVYFATENLLHGLVDAFKKIRESCEPTMFALEQLLRAIAEDPNSSPSLLHNVYPALNEIIKNEIQNRSHLINRGVKFVNLSTEPEPSSSQSRKCNNSTPSRPTIWNVRDLEECEICRCTLYLSKVKNTRRNVFVCLEHALKVMVNKKNPVRAPDLLMYLIYPTEELKAVMVKLVARLRKRP